MIMSRFIQRLKDKGYKVTGDIVILFGLEVMQNILDNE